MPIWHILICEAPFYTLTEERNILKLAKYLDKKGNMDVMKQADWLIDVGPDGGTARGEIVFAGTPKDMAEHSHTITAEYLRKSM